MSILIKDMNISKKDAESCVCTIKTLRNLAYNTHGVLDWVDHENCDKIIEMLELLVEIPTPHGRLIDADELIRELASEHVGGLDAIKKYTNADTWTSGLHTAWRLIDDAETVIEAEGSET